MRFKLVRLLLIPLLLTLTFPQAAQAQAQIVESQVDYTFGESIRFKAVLQAGSPVREATILFDVEGITHIEPGTASLEPDGSLSYVYDLTSRQPIRPFSTVKYRYRVNLEDGETFTSEFFSFYYIDNRFPWETLDEPPFQIHWYAGDVAFAQNVLDVAKAGLVKVQDILTNVNSGPVSIYVYANARDMEAALQTSSQNWVAGHADPDLGVILVAIPAGPDQNLLMEQRIPHELMHVLLFNATGPAYSDLPTWLNEGLASVSELYPNPDHQVLIENASENGRILPMSSLCETFPRDASSALLAYAQSASFTSYLMKSHGMSEVNQLMVAYADGLGCERGFEAAIGRSLLQVERQWRQDSLAENTNLTAATNLMPWAAVLLLVLAAPLLGSLAFLIPRQSRHTPAG